MDYDKATKRLRLKFKKARWNDKEKIYEYCTLEYETKSDTLQIYYNRGWKYVVFINAYDEDRYEHKWFSKKKNLIEYLDRIDAKYVQKYWSD